MAQVQQLYNQGKLGELSRNGELDIADHDLYSVVLASLSCISLEKTWQKLMVQHYIGSWSEQVPKLELTCGARPTTLRTLVRKKIDLYDLNYMLEWSACKTDIAQNLAQASIRTWILIVKPDSKQEHQLSDKITASCDFRFIPVDKTWRLTQFTIISSKIVTNIPCRGQA